MKTTFVDTAFVIAWVNEDDALHTKAIQLLNAYKNAPWLTTDCVLLEIGNSLARSFRSEAVGTIKNFLTSEEIIIIGLAADLFLQLSLLTNVAAGNCLCLTRNAYSRYCAGYCGVMREKCEATACHLPFRFKNTSVTRY